MITEVKMQTKSEANSGLGTRKGTRNVKTVRFCLLVQFKEDLIVGSHYRNGVLNDFIVRVKSKFLAKLPILLRPEASFHNGQRGARGACSNPFHSNPCTCPCPSRTMQSLSLSYCFAINYIMTSLDLAARPFSYSLPHLTEILRTHTALCHIKKQFSDCNCIENLTNDVTNRYT